MPERLTQLEQLEVQLIPELRVSVAEQRPISLDIEEVGVIRKAFERSDVNFDISSKERKKLVSGNTLGTRVMFSGKDNPIYIEIYDYDGKRWKTFEDAEFTDRSFGMNAMLGKKRFKDIIEHCYIMMKMAGYKGTIGKSKHDGTRGRGYTQAAADILQIALQDPDEESLSEDTIRAMTRLNKRLFKGYLKTTPESEHDEIVSRFKAIGIEKPKATLASFDPTMLPVLVYYIAAYRE